jgi:hypothetical protein
LIADFCSIRLPQSQLVSYKKDMLKVTELAVTVASRLRERRPDVVYQIDQIVQVLGTPTVEELCGQAEAIQAAGGERLANGTRKRTLGGIFFRLARERTPPAQRDAIWKRAAQTAREIAVGLRKAPPPPPRPPSPPSGGGPRGPIDRRSPPRTPEVVVKRSRART